MFVGKAGAWPRNDDEPVRVVWVKAVQKRHTSSVTVARAIVAGMESARGRGRESVCCAPGCVAVNMPPGSGSSR